MNLQFEAVHRALLIKCVVSSVHILLNDPSLYVNE